MELEALQALLRECGVVGAGGAGFPAYAKLNAGVDTILLNCAECEPLLTLHRQLLERRAPEILRALAATAEAMGASRSVVCVKAEYERAVLAVRSCMEGFRGVELKLLESVYPMGDEVVLLHETTGRTPPPGGLPLDVGAAVFNVETMYNVSRALEGGRGVTHKLVTVTGAVARPLTVRVPVGASVADVTAMAGGAQVQDPAYLVGGPMMGFVGTAVQPVTKTTNAILVLPRDHALVLSRTVSPSAALRRAASACCQCQTCTDLCPRHLLGHPVTPHLFMRAAANGDVRDAGPFVNTLFCCGCGVCELYACPQGLSPRVLMAQYKNGLRNAGVSAPPGLTNAPAAKERALRKVPERRLQARLGLGSYGDAPLDETPRRVGRVKILFSQHIGAPAVPTVERGAAVRCGQVLARPAQGLSAAVHASVDGTVLEVNEAFAILSCGQSTQGGGIGHE